MSFEWRKDEEDGWEEQVSVSVVVERPSPPYRLYAAIVIALIIFGGIGYWQLRKRAQTTVQTMETQALASFKLLQQAVWQRDLDLFNSVLSKKDGRYMAEQMWMWGHKYWDRPTLGLRWLSTAVVSPTITLLPDLTQAEVVLPQPYGIERLGGVTETVVLSQTVVFRRSTDGWFLAAPDDGFWGEEQTLAGQHVDLTFPARDRKVVLQLLDELDSVVQSTCFRVTNVPCHPELRVPVELTNQFTSLGDYCFPTDYPEACQIEMPSPTLLGLPQDEAGLQALARGYAAHILPSLLPTISGWEGERPTFYTALVEWEMYQWNFPSFNIIYPSGTDLIVLHTNHYDNLVNQPVTLQEIGLFWASGGIPRVVSHNHVRGLIAFLLERGETAVSLQRRIATPNFWQWANLPANDPTIEQEWLQFLYDQSTSAAQLPPVPLPEADIRLVCSDSVYRYDGLVWQDEMMLYDEQALVDVVPHDDGLIVSERYFEEAAKEFRGRAFWVHGEKSIQLTEWRTNTDEPLVSSQNHDAAGRKLVLQEVDPVNRNPLYRLLDLDNCREDTCSMSYLSGWPVWSSDGRSTLIMQTNLSNLLVPQQTQLWLGDADGQIVAELGRGYAPFWLDEERYGYVRLNDEGQSEVVVAHINNGMPRLFLTMARLWEYLPELADPLSAFVASVLVNPTNVDNLLITVATRDSDDTFLFSVEWQADQVSKIRRLGVWHGVIESVYSPDGRFILVDTLSKENGLHTLMFDMPSLNMEADDSYLREVSNVAAYAWTPDSNWLLINYPGFLKLTAPEHHYQKIIPHGFGNCGRVELVTGEDNDD